VLVGCSGVRKGQWRRAVTLIERPIDLFFRRGKWEGSLVGAVEGAEGEGTVGEGLSSQCPKNKPLLQYMFQIHLGVPRSETTIAS